MTNVSALLNCLEANIESQLGNYLYTPQIKQNIQITVENYLRSLNTVAAPKVRCTMGNNQELYVDIEIRPINPVSFTITTSREYYNHRTFV